MVFLAAVGMLVAAGVVWWRLPPSAPAGMVWIPAGEFQMGTPGSTPNRQEQPAHRVRLSGFFMDATEVTNASFQEFVNATGYVTTAEKPVDWEQFRKQLPPGTPRPPDDQMGPGALVFSPPQGAVPLDNPGEWWRWVPGAQWRHPTGPESTIEGLEQHPVVCVSWDDAVAYARWAGKRLPTEAEWEYAARGGLEGRKFIWGDREPTDEDGRLANIWQGDFPWRNTAVDGWDRTAPVRSYPPNGFGLYEMGGNAWEWCSDWYRADAYAGRVGVTVNPRGPNDHWDPMEPLVPKRVMRGGSYLCHVDYCESYRPAARRGTAFDTGMSHVGFRCVRDRDSAQVVAPRE